jgi:hypothetical protein
MKKSIIIAAVFVLNIGFSQSQKEFYKDIQITFDSIVKKQNANFVKAKNQDLSLRLKDSTYHYFSDDQITICESNPEFTYFPTKIYYTYNSIGKLTELISISFNEFECDLTHVKRLITYNSNNDVLQELDLVLDNQTQNWIPVTKTLYNYDDSNNNTEIIRQYLENSFSVWKNSAKYNFTYNAINQKVNETISLWQMDTNNWIANTTIDFQYTNDNLVYEFMQFKETLTTPWQNGYLTTKAFDENNNLVDFHYKSGWNEDSQAWYFRNHEVYNYTDGVLVEKTFENTSNNLLNYTLKTIYINNSFGKPTEAVNTSFNDGLWTNQSKVLYSYNIDNLIENEYYYQWDINNTNWDLNGTQQYTYLNGVLQNEQYSSMFFSLLKEYDEYQNLTRDFYSNMYENSDTYHYYSNSTLQNESFVKLNSEVTIFPNPIIDFMTISANENINSIAVFNVLGQLVFEKKVNAKEEKIDLTALTSGNYIVKINSETSSKVLKIIKQ